MERDLSTLREELRKCGESIMRIADELSSTVETPKEKQPSLEDVRAVLAEKARLGLTPQVRELLKRHGAEKLSDVNPEEYSSLLKEAEGINAR